MNAGAGRAAPRRRPSSTAVLGLVVVALVAGVLWWFGGRGGSSPAREGTAAGPIQLRVQAATGRAVEGRWTVFRAGSGPASASYQVRVVTADGDRTVAAAETWSTSVKVGGLKVGGRYRLVVTPQGAGPPVTSAPVTVLADQRPNPPSQVTMAALAGSNGLRVTWVPDPNGMAATGATVQLYDGLASQGTLQCRAGCTTAAFRGLPYGRRYVVRVVPVNDAGEGPPASSDPVDLTSPCPALPACVTVDAAAVVGPARHRAQGFLNSLYPTGDMVARFKALVPNAWRGSPTYQAATGTLDWTSWDVAVAAGAQTTMILSNLWHAETATSAGARPPWADWAAYGAWVTKTVRAIVASGHQVAYWDIQNEPGSPSYYSPADWAASTVADYLTQFSVAYDAIQAAVPTAQIVGPSLSHFADYPDEYNSREPDLVTFLDFAAQHGLQLAAVSWHEIDNDLGSKPRDFNRLPAMIEDHVTEGRLLIAARPALGRPEVWVNEYGRQRDYAIPGWTLGDLAAIERATIDRAGRSCWPEPGPGGAVSDDCSSPTIDGLLATDGSMTRASYWVYATYAHMTGNVVTAISNDASLSVLATRADPSGRVVAMVGRDVSCLPGVNLVCVPPGAVTVAPITVSVAFHLPSTASSADVNIARIPAALDVVPAPTTVSQDRLPVTAGRLTVSLPSVGDGEVYVVTIGR